MMTFIEKILLMTIGFTVVFIVISIVIFIVNNPKIGTIKIIVNKWNF